MSFPVNFNERESARLCFVHLGMGGFDQRAFAHAPRAPQQRVVGGQAFGKPPGVF